MYEIMKMYRNEDDVLQPYYEVVSYSEISKTGVPMNFKRYFSSRKKDDCVKFCKKHSIKIG